MLWCAVLGVCSLIRSFVRCVAHLIYPSITCWSLVQELIDEGVMTAADAESWPDLSSTLWTFCCQTCQAVAEGPSASVRPAVRACLRVRCSIPTGGSRVVSAFGHACTDARTSVCCCLLATVTLLALLGSHCLLWIHCRACASVWLLWCVAATPTVPPAKIDDCTSTLVEPCIASLDTPPRTSKACMAAALSGSDACSADNSDCFRTLYDYCQNLDPIE